MQSNRTQAAEHARDQRGKGQPQQEAKRKRTETRRVLRAIRGRIRGRTSMRRHRKRGLCVACCVVLEASCPAQTATGEAVFILRPQNYALPGMPEREKRSPAHWVAEHEVKPPPRKRGRNRARSHARSRTRYAGRVRLHAPAAHRTVAPGTRRRHACRHPAQAPH